PPSASPLLNSSFGQFFGDTSVSSSASWIESEETPEPASCSMVLLGLAVAGFLRRRTGRRTSKLFAPTPCPLAARPKFGVAMFKLLICLIPGVLLVFLGFIFFVFVFFQFRYKPARIA